MPGKYSQNTKGWKGRIAAENISAQETCKIVASKLGVRGTLAGNKHMPENMEDDARLHREIRKL